MARFRLWQQSSARLQHAEPAQADRHGWIGVVYLVAEVPVPEADAPAVALQSKPGPDAGAKAGMGRAGVCLTRSEVGEDHRLVRLANRRKKGAFHAEHDSSPARVIAEALNLAPQRVRAVLDDAGWAALRHDGVRPWVFTGDRRQRVAGRNLFLEVDLLSQLWRTGGGEH